MDYVKCDNLKSPTVNGKAIDVRTPQKLYDYLVKELKKKKGKDYK